MSRLRLDAYVCIGYVAPIRRWRSSTSMGLCSGGELICLEMDAASLL